MSMVVFDKESSEVPDSIEPGDSAATFEWLAAAQEMTSGACVRSFEILIISSADAATFRASTSPSSSSPAGSI